MIQSPGYNDRPAAVAAVAAATADQAVASGADEAAVLFVTTCWWPSLARLMHQVQRAGLRVGMVAPPGHCGRAVPGIASFRYRPFRPLRALSAAIASFQPSVLVAGDDRAVAHLHRLHDRGTASERRLIARSLGDPSGYGAAASRAVVLAEARATGMDVPGNAIMATAADVERWTGLMPPPYVLKIDGAWSGTGVRIARTADQAREAFQTLRAGPKLLSAIKQFLINRDPFWLADWLARTPPRITAQGFVTGVSGNLAMFCQDGAVLSCIAAENVACWGETGPSTIVRLEARPVFTDAARALAAALRLSGFIGLDFMTDAATGRAVLIEMNPRATPLCNIRGGAGEDLVAAAIRAWSGRDIPPAPDLAGPLVAHFPLALHWNPADPRLAQCHLDIPHEAPALVRAMLEPYWPDSHLLARALVWLQRLSGRDDHFTKVRLRGVAKLPRTLFAAGTHPEGAGSQGHSPVIAGH